MTSSVQSDEAVAHYSGLLGTAGAEGAKIRSVDRQGKTRIYKAQALSLRVTKCAGKSYAQAGLEC